MIMDYKTAFDILDIEFDSISELKIDYLKKKYHRLALQNHPDKNSNSQESTEKFKLINEAYEYLKREISIHQNISNASEQENSNYFNILNEFVEGMLKGKYNAIISSIIKDVVCGCKKITLKLFEDLEKERAIEVYTFLSRYKNVLHIGQDTLNDVREIVLEKSKDDCVYILNPSLDDLFDCNVYKLEINRILYFVPLWHSEVYFDGSDSTCEIIVKCVPDLPDNVYIDENNNLFVDLTISFTFSLFENEFYHVKLGNTLIPIRVSDLKMQRVQTYCLKGCGITEINENDIYNLSKKGDIYFKITFIM